MYINTTGRLSAVARLTFAILLGASSCAPRQYTDLTGKYTHLQGKEYIRSGDSLTAKGYPVYQLVKSQSRTFGGQTVQISKR